MKSEEDTSTLPYTESGLYQVQNYTRYLTEDLIELCNEVERALMLISHKKGVSNPILGRSHTHSNDQILVFDNYARTKNPKSGRRYSKELPYVKPGWRQDVRIVSPEDLFASPLELLASSSDEKGTKTPKDVALQCVSRLVGLYNLKAGGGGYAHNLSNSVNADLYNKKLTLRFGNKAKKKPVKESGDLRLRRLSRDRVKEASWSVATALRTFKEMFESIDAANAYAKKRGVASYIDKDLAKLFERQLIIYRSNIDVVYNNLKNSLEQP